MTQCALLMDGVDSSKLHGDEIKTNHLITEQPCRSVSKTRQENRNLRGIGRSYRLERSRFELSPVKSTDAGDVIKL